MTSPIISAAVANHINEIIQNSLDNRLFLFCNYEPTFPLAVSEEGKFYLAVQDLYKFAIDSSCILKNWDKFLPIGFRPNYCRIGEILSFISEVRSAIDHNRSDANGWFEQNSVEFYQQWVIGVISKDTVECEGDYSLLCMELEMLADELVKLTEKFAYHFATRTDKQSVIEKWISETLRWYTQTSKTDIYRGQMVNAYVVRIMGEGRPIEDWSHKTMFDRTSRWIMNKYIYPLLAKKEKLISDIDKLEAALLPDNKETESLFSGLSDCEIERVKEGLREELEDKKRERQEVTKQLITNNGIKNPDKDYFNNLSNQIRETMQILEQEGVAYSLLPQSILQEDIERVFSQVPVPEN